MSAISYDGKAIIPAPMVSIRKETIVAGNGNVRLGGMLNITLKGKLIADKGSPDSTGTFWTSSGYPADETLEWENYLASILAKQEALRTLFQNDGRTLLIQPWDGSQPTQFNPLVKSINFPESPGVSWFNECEFEITLECQDPDDSPYSVSEISEEWHLEPVDEKLITFRLTHSISATGKIKYDASGVQISTPWQSAQTYVLTKLQLGAQAAFFKADGVMNLDSYTPYSNVRQQQVNEITGVFSVIETFIVFNAGTQYPAWEDFNVDGHVSEEGRTTATIHGTVTGLEQRDSNWNTTTTRYSNAQNQFSTYVLPNLLTRCQTMLGIVLNAIPISQEVGRNPVTGVITYSYQYSNRPPSIFLGSISENITQTDENPNDVFASIPVLGRALGPVLQAIGTVTARKRSLNLEVVMPCATMVYTASAPDTDLYVLATAPAGSVVFLDKDSSSWNAITGRYSRQVGWTWES